MITNLFSTFDPSTSIYYSINWIRTIIILIVIPYPYWVIKSRQKIIIDIIYKTLHQEFKTLLSKSEGLTLIITSLFIFILVNNIIGLLPYIFTRSRHLIFSLALSLPLWISIILFGWINKTQHIFRHLIPAGTPGILIPFIVCIETISNIIRPGSLAVRLTANIIAGHLLIRLLGNNTTRASTIIIIILITVQIILILFETAVAIIQAYVFSVLTTLYSSEVNYAKK